MGPFTIVKDDRDGYKVNDRWCDPAATVDTIEHGEAWIELFYKTQALQDQFLRTNVHVALQNMQERRREYIANAERQERRLTTMAANRRLRNTLAKAA